MKLLIFLTAVAISYGSDLDDIVGEHVPVAVSPSIKIMLPQCANYLFMKTDIQCSCNGQSVTVAKLARGDLNAIQVLPIVVRTAEAAAAMNIRSEDCACPGDINPEVGVLRIVNDNYFITYLSGHKTAILSRRTVDTRQEFDAVIKAIGFGTDYGVLCNDFVSVANARPTVDMGRHVVMYGGRQ